MINVTIDEPDILNFERFSIPRPTREPGNTGSILSFASLEDLEEYEELLVFMAIGATDRPYADEERRFLFSLIDYFAAYLSKNRVSPTLNV
jgi:hypothetical protein